MNDFPCEFISMHALSWKSSHVRLICANVLIRCYSFNPRIQLWKCYFRQQKTKNAMQVILMQLVYEITWLVIPNCDLNMTICHPYLFRFDRFISKYFLDDANDTFDDVIASWFEIEIMKISYRALTCSDSELQKLPCTKISSVR